MKKIKINDHVIAYDSAESIKGIITGFDMTGNIILDGKYTFHPKQCRKLKNQNPKKQRNFWVYFPTNGRDCTIRTVPMNSVAGWVHVREVLKR